MESRLIPAVVLVPALAWSACNGGTENLGDGEGGGAGAELTSTTTGQITQGNADGNDTGDASGSGGNSATGPAATGSGGLGSGGTGNTDGSLPDSGPIGNGSGGGTTGAGGMTGAGGNFGASAGGMTGAGGITGAGGNFGAGGGVGANTTTVGMGAGGGLGAGGATAVYAGATRIYQSSQVIPMLTSDTEQLYTGGSNLAAVALPMGPATLLNTATYGTTVAVDASDLYVCSPGGALYRMSKQGGGTQNYQGAEVDANSTCSGVAVDDTTVSAAWFNPDSHALRVRRWAKSARTSPEDGLELDDLGEAYAPALIAESALYYADRTNEELLIGRIQLDDYTDELVLSVDAEFDSEYLAPLAVTGNALFYQSCEQIDRWCSLFTLPSDDDEPIPFEMFQRDSVVRALAPLGEGVVIALSDGIYLLEAADAEPASLWTHPSMVSFGPLLMLEASLYLVSNPVYGAGSMLWRLPISDE